MRLMSFSLTTRQVRESTPEKPLKDVTRRIGWECLKPGERVQACEKVMGRRKGEPLVRLREIEVVSVRRERLDEMTRDTDYGFRECQREGPLGEDRSLMFPHAFVEFFCASHTTKKKPCTPETVIHPHRIRYIT